MAFPNHKRGRDAAELVEDHFYWRSCRNTYMYDRAVGVFPGRRKIKDNERYKTFTETGRAGKWCRTVEKVDYWFETKMNIHREKAKIISDSYKRSRSYENRI